MNELHLSAKHQTVVEALLREHLPGVEVWAYGSRVNGRSHDGSDLDLVLRRPGLNEVSLRCLGPLREFLRESSLPFLVDVRNWSSLPERFQRQIEREHFVLIEKEV